MKTFEHWKKKTIYGMLGEGISNLQLDIYQEQLTDNTIVACHHDTQKEMIFTRINEDYYMSPDKENYVLYRNIEDDSDTVWAREYEDFNGFKELPDGTFVRRFKPLFEEGKYIRPQAEITVPDNYLQTIEQTMKIYKKWLKENEKLQEKADVAETEEERDEALKKVTEHFKRRYAGVLAKDMGDRLSVSKIDRIWEKFMRDEYRGFLNAHLNLTMKQIIEIGIDKFIYVMGWKRPSDVITWHNNKLRVGTCCHCKDQFIPMILQYNNGLCINCRPLFSQTAIRKFVLKQLNVSERYKEASRDLLMDFYIMFYHDEKLRNLFLAGTDTAEEMEKFEYDLPDREVSQGETSGL